MFSPTPAPSTAGSGYTRARTPQGGMSPTALSALFPTATTGEGLTTTEVASQKRIEKIRESYIIYKGPFSLSYLSIDRSFSLIDR